MNESFYCLDCRTQAPLNIRGTCSTCGSKAVVSEHAQWIGFTKWAEDALSQFEATRASVN